jgi:hypothetical protein
MNTERLTELRVEVDVDLPEHLLFDEVVRAVHQLRVQVHPRDRMDAVVIVDPRMRLVIEAGALRLCGSLAPLPPPERVDPLRELTDPPPVDHLFGMSLETFSRPDWGVIELRCENSYDRALRRAQERGQSIIVHKPDSDLFALIPPPPPPTLRRLLGHWAQKAKRKLGRPS